MLLLALDLAGTFVFALSGASAAVQRKLDLFGVLVLGFVAASCGGMTRDVLLGVHPPAALADWRYLAVSISAGLAVFAAPGLPDRLNRPVQVFDAAGLGLYAVAGTQKALLFGLNPVSAALLGLVTGIGGGIARDILLARVPMVLRPGLLYAVAALCGAGVVVAGHALGIPPVPTTLCGVALAFAVRILAIRRNWQLPTAHRPDRQR